MAAAPFTLEISGLRELLADLEQLEEEFRGPILAAVGQAAGEIAVEEIRRRAPRRSGRLIDSINDPRKTRSQGEVVGAVIAIRKMHGFYWRFQEFGTRKQPARPFIRPALDAKAEEMRAAAAEVVQERLDAILGRRRVV